MKTGTGAWPALGRRPQPAVEAASHGHGWNPPLPVSCEDATPERLGPLHRLAAARNRDRAKRPGTCGFVGPPGLPETREHRLNVELDNGGLGKLAIIGIFLHDRPTGSAMGDWPLYTGSPQSALMRKLGVQPHEGFFDPLSVSMGGDIAAFKRRLSVVIKHGRTCMLAAMGSTTSAITGKLPG